MSAYLVLQHKKVLARCLVMSAVVVWNWITPHVITATTSPTGFPSRPTIHMASRQQGSQNGVPTMAASWT